MKRVSTNITQTRISIYIIKYKRVLFISSILLFTILLSSCKTCKCPAYTQNHIFYKEQKNIKVNISLYNNLFALKNPTLKNELSN